MGRELKRVPMDFSHPIGVVWPGYLFDKPPGYDSLTDAEQDEVLDAFIPAEPPSGDGYQLWETTSEGSPASPVFASAEELAAWCVDGATVFGREKTTYERWLKMFTEEGGTIGCLMVMDTSTGYIGALINKPEKHGTLTDDK